MKIVDDSSVLSGGLVIETYSQFVKYKHTNAVISKTNYERFMNLYLSMSEDENFVRPEKPQETPKQENRFDPYQDLNEKNKLLAELKAKNVVYRKDPTMIPVKIATSEQTPELITFSAKDIVDQTFE